MRLYIIGGDRGRSRRKREEPQAQFQIGNRAQLFRKVGGEGWPSAEAGAVRR